MPKENKFATIKEGGSKKMRVKRVVYAKLLIEADDNRTLVFGSQSKLLLEGDNIPAETAERLAREVADGRHDEEKAPFGPTTPFDIPVWKQTWLIIRLDPSRAHWQFEKDERACTGKKAQTGRNCRLRNVYASNHPDPPQDHIERGKVSRDGCRVILLGVSERAKKGQEGYRELVNLHTEFLHG
jgi:hypothetical protein